MHFHYSAVQCEYHYSAFSLQCTLQCVWWICSGAVTAAEQNSTWFLARGVPELPHHQDIDDDDGDDDDGHYEHHVDHDGPGDGKKDLHLEAKQF